jgi:hypothetical protein
MRSPNSSLANATYEIEWGYEGQKYISKVSLHNELEFDTLEVNQKVINTLAQSHNYDPDDIDLLRYRLVAQYNNN